ncbi:hypothetical protein MK805_14545 [Shimazuella sp. AN120528]|uniref:hypothetical protein n=1 Tax=Shimazuella soli TaxID=1892854 RepID=UPI001F0FF36A|nr:hypothetical protein [Shimazuella soli]MCH5586158.1 hypothetical protein [Shimazuella soli]
MSERYVPKIQEAAIPEDGGWVEGEKCPILLLSIPAWEDLETDSEQIRAYVWMYDRGQDAYLFCYQLKDGTEKAIAFISDHAGLLLKEEHAKGTFSMMIMNQGLQEVSSSNSVLLIENINLVRHPSAGW